ncbi:MAG: hypothetical protein KBF88_08440 [Polyangiaceae bacterium]|nr:hypothetical protein [Polyangiaceae bacterium]
MKFSDFPIVYFGLPQGARVLREEGHDLRLVCLSRRDSPGTKTVQRLFPGRVLLCPKLDDPRVRRQIEAIGPKLLVSWFWTKRIPKEVLRIAPAFGVHPSLLPQYRGADPTFWTIANGDKITGVTAHRLEHEYDTGAILGVKTIKVKGSWTSWQLAKALDAPSLRLLRSITHAYRSGNAPEELPQSKLPKANVSEAPQLTDEQLEINWDASTSHIERFIRAASPYPGAYAWVGNNVVTIVRARPTRVFPNALHPGEGFLERGLLGIRTRDGALLLQHARISDSRDREHAYAGRAIPAALGL